MEEKFEKSIRCPKELHKLLKNIANMDDLTMQEVVKEAIKQYIELWKKKKMVKNGEA